ncbi:unnamed protein product [Rhizophagus irregularis]|uniref:Uncharacterized protein n=1 Tax=Rhizophagus irregularis TaxID=588596 RepID=A0A915ZTY4_9GLOM|nr:unnamed protein product [Rhizophagus irregularis]CAB5390830.1 unnamed protein product [Rhizophagus irregularis]
MYKNLPEPKNLDSEVFDSKQMILSLSLIEKNVSRNIDMNKDHITSDMLISLQNSFFKLFLVEDHRP